MFIDAGTKIKEESKSKMKGKGIWKVISSLF